MKNIVQFKKINLEGNVTIDSYNPDLQYIGVEEYINQLLPYTRLFEKITIKNFNSLSADLLTRLTNQYLHGSTIVVDNQKKHFHKEYQLTGKTPAFYSYKWVELDLSKPVPRSLAEFKFMYNGKLTTYLNAIKTLTNTRYLPNPIWTALDKYSQERIAQCREYNRGNYTLAEDWYKQLMKDCKTNQINVFSPNKKTYYEVIAELTFDKDCADTHLQAGLQALNAEQLAFLNKYARAYGVEIPKFQWRINSRKTDHGYTQEPERVLNGMSNSDKERAYYDPRNNNNLPKNIRQGLKVKECDCDKLLRDAYFQLVWIMKHLKDEALMPGYKRCPICHEIYLESQGCSCGACQPIECVSADNLLYGISSTYEDYESTKSAYLDLEDLDI